MKEKNARDFIEFITEYASSTIALCGIVLFFGVISVFIGLSIVGTAYRISYLISPNNWQYIFFVTIFYAPVLAKFFYTQVKEAKTKTA